MSVRGFTRITAVWPSGSPTSSALPAPWGQFAGAQLHISGAWTHGYIGLKQYVFGAWQPLCDQLGGWTGVAIPTASGNCSLVCPPNWFYANGGDNTVMLWTHDGTGSGIPQADTRTVVLDLKS